MFHLMIKKSCEHWYNSEKCTVASFIDYIEKTGQMRDAQIEAIKVYLFLKIHCATKPLSYLFSHGYFNNINLDDIEISNTLRTYLKENLAAAALFEWATLTDESGNKLSPILERQIKSDPASIDYQRFFEDMFYGVKYTDYLFSLPMGAGKTYLMAAFIYIDLYFAMNETDNLAFAHNFIIFAPSGLKSSVVPSLKTIQKFNPAWIIPEPAAGDLKRKLIFEVLDQSKTTKKSNKVKNPNVQKISNHQPFSDLFGLVAVTNAEKVILDRLKETGGQVSLLEDSDDEKDKQANELRNLIGKLPALSVFIDEVHHAVSDDIKLRAVVNKWAENNTINSVIGFSGTPYLEKPEKIDIVDEDKIALSEISNVVYYYPLIEGINNFLKKPIVKISDVADSETIIEAGVREFLDKYKDTVYEDGLTAKLGIYCGRIEKLEEIVYPLVSRIVSEYGLSNDTILKFHKGSKKYPISKDSQMQFNILDSDLSKIKIVLLVQVGKEGWDCRSLTGIILSQEGDCPKNMVLQTSCRCLRQVEKDKIETALIYLNESNADKLNSQLQKQHHISLKEFSEADNKLEILKRYDRTDYLKLPKFQYYQLTIKYDTLIIDDKINTEDELKQVSETVKTNDNTIKTTDFSMEISDIKFINDEHGNDQATFLSWLYHLSKSSFGLIQINELNKYEAVLKPIFDKITYMKDGEIYYSSNYNIQLIEANIRKAFSNKRDIKTAEELIPIEANLLNISNFTTEVRTSRTDDYYPTQQDVEKIILDDDGKLKIEDKVVQMINTLKEVGQDKLANDLQSKYTSHPQKNHSFHYLPYKTDSDFEQTFLENVLPLNEIKEYNLEVYYNGDDTLTEFKICCYKSNNGKWQYIGLYTPDFLIIKRKDGQIYKAIIVETKGGIYANDPKFKDKKEFAEGEFIRQNNDAFGYKKFEYLYLEDTLPEKDRLSITHDKICKFFKEDS